MERLLKHLDKQGGDVQEYHIEDIKVKYILLDWVACQLVFERPIKTKQVFLTGKPTTQKTLLFHFLAKVLRIFFASPKRKYFWPSSSRSFIFLDLLVSCFT